MKWTDSCIELVDGTDTGWRESTFAAAGDSVTVNYDLPHINTVGHTVYVAGIGILTTNYIVTAAGGTSGGDRITLSVVPALNATIIIYYGWQGSSPGPFHSSRRPIDITPTTTSRRIITSGHESLWQIAGRIDIYNDPKLWWAIADVNPEITNLFESFFLPLPTGIVLFIPTLAEIGGALG